MKPPWRQVALGGMAAGLALSPALAPAPDPSSALPVALALACAAAAAADRTGPARLLAVALAAAVAGAWLGAARLERIDAGALRGEPGAPVEVSGHIAAPPRSGPEGLSAELDTAEGRVLLELGWASAGEAEPAVGDPVTVSGRLAEPPPWLEGHLRRRGIALTLKAERVDAAGEPRAGPTGRVDAIRSRAETALERGMPEREAALARGFVLGQDDRIDPAAREDFRRSGLAHLLAVSGQNVILLCLLAWPLLAMAGVALRPRLLILLALIALYVPVTGAGPSIQRAAVMGGAGLVAALAGRPGSRWYALLLAAALTLALNPRASGDAGWQLSFAAVAGIFCWSRRVAALLDGGRSPGSPRRALADGAGMTVAATLATAPLMVAHFESLSVAALPANLLALPAVAPAMWLGMLAGMAGQMPAIPVEPLNWLNSLCLAYIGQIARWLGSPGWAQLDLGLGGPVGVAVAFACVIAIAEGGLRLAAHAPGLGAGRLPRLAAAGLAAAIGALALAQAVVPGRTDARDPDELRVTVLDVGQGDSILLEPPGGDPVLVDAGPPGGRAAERLRELGVERLDALVLTHDQSDHSGGAAEVLAAVPADAVLTALPSARLAGLAAAAGAGSRTLAEGGELRSGELRLTALWPPRELLAASDEDPNRLSLVLVAEWRHFSMLLSGDAEAEAVPLDPGPLDVLKVAHHGSADDALGALLERTAPKVAVISVGENGYGHPAPDTLAELDEHEVPALRTDETGEIGIEAGAEGWALRG